MTKKELVFLGPPASGKGTQTSRLSKELNFPHVDTGSLLRKAMADGTEDGKIAKGYIEKGALVPVEIVASIIKTRLKENDCANGFILDGFPRSTEQADMLEKMLQEIDEGQDVDFKVIYFDIDQKLLIDRIIYRRSCSKCGKIYNLQSLKPTTEGICDDCGSPLTQRKDDTEEIAKSRFETYFKETAPLIEYYDNKGSLVKLDANGDINDVWERLLTVVK
jgi:adenylate kinase